MTAIEKVIYALAYIPASIGDAITHFKAGTTKCAFITGAIAVTIGFIINMMRGRFRH